MWAGHITRFGGIWYGSGTDSKTGGSSDAQLREQVVQTLNNSRERQLLFPSGLNAWQDHVRPVMKSGAGVYDGIRG